MLPKTELRTECIRLRVEERLSLREIHDKTGASKGSLSAWLHPFPLTEAELESRLPPPPTPPRKERGEESELHRVFQTTGIRSTSHMGKVSEAAVLLRLLAHGFSVYGSPFDGDTVDWVADTGTRLVRIQVKTASAGPTGLPMVSLRRAQGRSRYGDGDFDFLVGFDLFTDTAYVWAVGELQGLKASITICPEAEERWDKLKV